MLHPRLFKIMLIRSKNTSKYAQYYLLLEECIKYYNEYQLLLLNKKVKGICKDRVLELDNQEKKERFIICLNKEFTHHPYSIVKGQKKSIRETFKNEKLNENDIIVNIPCCYANNLYNKVKEHFIGQITYQKKYLYVVDKKVIEWSYDAETMKNEHNHVSVTRNIGLINITLDEFVHMIKKINNARCKI